MIRSVKFLPSEVVICFQKSAIQLWTEYYCHTWAGVPNSYLGMLNKLQKRVGMTVGLFYM